MNVFKLLSRSSKTTQTSSTQKLPSSGAVANPQLFGHYCQAPQEVYGDKKRKRNQPAGQSQDTLPAELDFFGGGAQKVETESVGRGKRKRIAIEKDTEEAKFRRQETETYNEDECKRVLRSHKLKMMVLEDFAAEKKEEREQKQKKRSKKRKRETVKSEVKTGSKKQLYPQPLTTFAQLRTRHGISRRLAENLEEQGYKMPTEVQLGALPLLLAPKNGIPAPTSEASSSGAEYEGNIDLLAIAPTGSGKTIAFLIPIINSLLSENRTLEIPEGPRAVIIAPTRELASQIVNETRKLAKGTRVKATLMKKGMEVVDRSEEDPPARDQNSSDSGSDSEKSTDAVQQKKCKRRAEKVKSSILVTTPLALLNALKRSDDSVAKIPSVHHLVLDEADVLLDPLFREQTLSLWNACTNPALRIGLWSATIGSNIEALATNTMNSRWSSLAASDPKLLPPRAPLIRLVVGLKDSAIPNISHQLTYAATEQGKLLGLRQLLHPTAVTSAVTSLRPPFLVFTQTIPRAVALHSELLYDIPPEAGGSSRIAVLHADLSSTAREAIMTRFRRGEIWVLVTTDLLARGVDFRGLNGVVNYDVPTSAAAYVHRVGRTGRAGREGGVAVTFYTQEDIPYVKLIANVIRASENLNKGGEGVKKGVQKWLLDALPTPSKRDRKELKKRGVKARRTVKDEKGKPRARISTKSGYERRLEERKRAMRANRKREEVMAVEDGSESDFEGFGD